ncbi:hypothetical protein Clacol_010273 [Clathrus columnatus]|uniref:Glucose-methanol-choline oxidoreductase C-terminal domain-containing protein n=1 Tax=Clathrus columnatus TaxID=1419009 RepID=A0AAV5AS69_9AGAM|nr:hypothetical protein Clacol_010273 [Clathrus columnatus]
MRPISRGQVTLRSNDPAIQPEINLNFFGEEADLEAMREAARFVRDILTTGESLKDLVVSPYPDDLADLDGDNKAANNLVLRRCSTGYHPNGTCRIGRESGEYAGVLDEKMKVRGVASLRVIDASAIPLMPDCRIQAGVYMLGEKVNPSFRMTLDLITPLS